MKKKETANNQMHLRKKNMKVSESNRTSTLNPTLTSWSSSVCPRRKKRNRKGNYMTDKFKRIGPAKGGHWEVV